MNIMTKKQTALDQSKTGKNLVVGDLSVPKNSISLSKYKVYMLVALSLVLLGAGLYLSLPSKGPCEGDRKLIDKYNSQMHSKGVYSLKSIRDSIDNKQGNEQDATCVYIKMLAAYGNASTTGNRPVLEEYSRLIKLLKQGKKLNPAVQDGIDKTALFKDLQSQVEDSKRGYYAQG